MTSRTSIGHVSQISVLMILVAFGLAFLVLMLLSALDTLLGTNHVDRMTILKKRP